MNLLKNETSPYLSQHKDNPVNWMPWGREAFDKAKAEGKPVLLSVGYSSCHWCHVMAHESFEDAKTAAIMNDHFVNIKVDREERPDVDMLYQQALSLTGKQGGWPLTMFLLPDGRPFYGGTYFPPVAKYGMSAFIDILLGVSKSYRDEKDKVAHNVERLELALKEIQTSPDAIALTPDVIDTIADHYLSLIDPQNGGLGSAPKFPQLCVMGYLWDAHLRKGQDRLRSAVVTGLVAMCQGGLYDHAGGGFHRYTVDEGWLVPHFEKMLYDNALFVSLLSQVYAETQHPLFRARISETVSFMLDDMRERDAFVTSFDADSEGHEGKYYVWREDEIDAVLGAEADNFKKRYDVTKFGNWEGTTILNRLSSPEWLGDAEEEKLQKSLKKLNETRKKRVPPGRDDKILCDLNGLAISALARAADALNAPEYRAAAKTAFAYVGKNLQKQDGTLLHAAGVDGLLDDYAYMIKAALLLNETAIAQKWTDSVLARFQDAQGGFFISEKPTAFNIRLKSAHDNPLPSGNGIMAQNLEKLAALTGDKKYAMASEKTLAAFAGAVRNNFYPYATLLGLLNRRSKSANDA